jgi:hypothetical protein
MRKPSGACKTSEADVGAIAAAAATGLPGLAAPSKSHISDILPVFQQHWSEQSGRGVSAKDFADKLNATEKSLTEQAFLGAGEVSIKKS